MNKYKFSLTIILIILLSACASTSLEDSWTNPQRSTTQVKKVLVLGVAIDEGKRFMFETEMAAALNERGVEAIAGSNVKVLRGQLSKEKVVEALKTMDVDSVAVTRIASYNINKDYHPGYTEVWVYGVPTIYGYLPTSTHTTVHDSYTYETTTVFLETSLFDSSDGTLIWSARTKTLQPQNNDVVRDLIKQVVPRMQRDGIVN